MLRLIPAALVLLLSTGCFLSKTKEDVPWNQEEVAMIEAGTTTKAELLQLLGPPTEIIRLLNTDAFIWRRHIEKNTGTFLLLINMERSDRQFDAITAIVNKDGIVEAIGSRFSSDQSSYGLPWGD